EARLTIKDKPAARERFPLNKLGRKQTMSRAYNCIDADGHILEPLELWAQYMDPKHRDHAPRLVRDNKGVERLLIGQKTLGSERGMASLGAVGSRDGTV